MHNRPPYWNQAITELSHADPVLARMIAAYQGEFLQGREDAFHTLLRSITGQQISVKAADAVWGKLAVQSKIKPKSVAELEDDALRACGYSRQKIGYIRSLCEFFLTHQHRERDWAGMTDEEVIRDLTQIKGIGRWTAEMFLIFHLLRPDVFPLDDIGLLKAIRLHYDEGGLTPLASLPLPLRASSFAKASEDRSPCSDGWNKSRYVALAELWRPWRSVATWYLWRSLDPVPVAY